MANMDIDEYITPVGKFDSIKQFLDELDHAGTKVIAFGSWRAWPRRDMIEPPVPIVNKTICDQPHPCFQLKVPTDRSILQTYNCDRQLVKKETMPAEKQIYRTGKAYPGQKIESGCRKFIIPRLTSLYLLFFQIMYFNILCISQR
jgi:hypothetical protein